MVKRPSLHLGVAAIEKGAFGSPSTNVANFIWPIDGALTPTTTPG